MTDQEKLDAIYQAVRNEVPALKEMCTQHAKDIAGVTATVGCVRDHAERIEGRLNSVDKRTGALGSLAGGFAAGVLMFIKALFPGLDPK